MHFGHRLLSATDQDERQSGDFHKFCKKADAGRDAALYALETIVDSTGQLEAREGRIGESLARVAKLVPELRAQFLLTLVTYGNPDSQAFAYAPFRDKANVVDKATALLRDEALRKWIDDQLSDADVRDKILAATSNGGSDVRYESLETLVRLAETKRDTEVAALETEVEALKRSSKDLGETEQHDAEGRQRLQRALKEARDRLEYIKPREREP